MMMMMMMAIIMDVMLAVAMKRSDYIPNGVQKSVCHDGNGCNVILLTVEQWPLL